MCKWIFYQSTKSTWRTTLSGLSNVLVLLGGMLPLVSAKAQHEVSSTALVTLEPLIEGVAFPSAPKNTPNYRIPAIVLATNGDVLAFCERRATSIGDLGDNDIVLRRSTDGGRTWSPDHDLYTEGYYANSDPTPLVDSTGRVWLFFCRDRKDFVVMHSDDQGHTWSEVRSIHDQVIDPAWDHYKGSVNVGPQSAANNPEKGRQWRKNWHQRYGVGCGAAAVELRQGQHVGRIVLPIRAFTLDEEGEGAHQTFVIYSDDRGRTWQRSGPAIRHGNECQVVELAGGRLIMNSRDGDNGNRPDQFARRLAYSDDGGATWFGQREERTIINPGVHAATKRYAHGGRDVLLVTTPADPFRQDSHPYGRRNLSLQCSLDEGKTWSPPQTIYADVSSYSDILCFPDGTVGVIYERGPAGSIRYWDELAFVRLQFHWKE